MKIIDIIIGLFAIGTCFHTIYMCIRAYKSGKQKYTATKSQQVLTSVPGICTAWGIFYTFLAILVCLGILVFTGETEDFSIFQITGSLIPAFITSVIGMWYSIHYSGKIKEIIAEEEFKEFRDYGNPLAHLNDVAKYSRDSFRLLNTLNQNILAIQNDFKSNFSGVHSELLNVNSSLTSQITALNNLNSDFKQHSSSTRNESVQLQQSLRTLLSNLDDSVQNTNQSLANQNNAQQEFLDKFVNDFEKYFSSAHSDFEQQMKDFTTEEVSKYTELLSNICEQMTSATKQIHDIQTDLVRTLNSRYDETVANTTRQAMESFNQNIQQSSDMMKTNMENAQREIVSSFNSTATSVHDSITALTSSVTEKLTELSENITTISTTSLETLKGETDFISEKVGKICSQYEQSQLAYTNALQNVHDSNANWENMISSNQSTLEQVKQTNELLTNVIDLVKNRQNEIQDLRREIATIAETITQLQELNSNLTKLNVR
jgi:hypothetical protein